MAKKKVAKKASAPKKAPAKKKAAAPKAAAPLKVVKGAKTVAKPAAEPVKPIQAEKPKRVRPSRAKKKAPETEATTIETTDVASGAPDVLPDGQAAGEPSSASDTTSAPPAALPAEDPGKKVVEMRGKRTLRTFRDIAGEKLEDIMGLVDEVEEARYRYEKSKESTKKFKDEFEELSTSLHRVLLDIRKIANGETNLPLLDGLDKTAVPKAIEDLIAAMGRADYVLSPEVASGLSSTERDAAMAWAKAEEVRLSYVKAGDSGKAMLVVVPALPVVLVRRLEAPPSAEARAEAAAAVAGSTEGDSGDTAGPTPEPAVDAVPDVPEGSAPKDEYLRAALLDMLEPESVPAVEVLALWSEADQVAAYVWASNPDAVMDQAPEIVKLLTVAPAAEDLAASFGAGEPSEIAGEPGEVIDAEVPGESNGEGDELEGVGFDEPDDDADDDSDDDDQDDE